MSVPANVILMWGGTNAGIPAGWTRETTLDDKYPKAWGSQNPNITGGSNTHTHTATTHGHTQISHTHDISWNATSSSGNASGSSGSMADNFGHNTATSGGSVGGDLQTSAITWQSANAEPPYYKLIFVKPDTINGSPTGAGLICHYNGSSLPLGWLYCNGSGGTLDLRGKYIKGASAGGDAGAGAGGTSHQHTITHGHTADSHYHTGTTAQYSTGSRQSGSSHDAATSNHTHTYTTGGTTDTVSNYTNTTAGSGDTVEVAYKKSGLIVNSTGVDAVGMIGLWLGSTASLPTGWLLCDGSNGTQDMRDKFIKIGQDLTEVGNTGGSNTHTHTGVSHTHSSTGGHTHGGTSDNAGQNGQVASGGDGYSPNPHYHTIASITSVTATYNNTTVDSGTAVDLQPAYTTAAYIQCFSLGGGGAFLFNFI
jgi:hypothetical protein